MTLKTNIASAVSNAKTATISLWKDVIYKSVTPDSYNTTTGVVTSSTTTVSVKALVKNYSQSEAQGLPVLSTEVMVLQSDLSVTPDTNDIIQIDGQDRLVKSFTSDIAETRWRITLEELT